LVGFGRSKTRAKEDQNKTKARPKETGVFPLLFQGDL